MLNIFADALLIATRMDARADVSFHHRDVPEPAETARRRWFALSGLRR